MREDDRARDQRGRFASKGGSGAPPSKEPERKSRDEQPSQRGGFSRGQYRSILPEHGRAIFRKAGQRVGRQSEQAMIDAGRHDAAGMKSKPVYATLCEAVPLTSHAPLTRVRAAFVKDHTDQVPDKAFVSDLKRKLSLRKVMHPDDEKKNEQDTPPEGLKFLKEDVNYRYASDPARSCGQCVHFRSGTCEIVSGLIRSVDVCDKFEAQERGRAVIAVLVDTNEVTPPGYEPIVRALKKKFSPKTGIPWAIAWDMKNRGIRPTKPQSEEGGPGSGPQSGSRSKFAPEHHEPDEPVRVETPRERKARMKKKTVSPERAAVVRKALGSA